MEKPILVRVEASQGKARDLHVFHSIVALMDPIHLYPEVIDVYVSAAAEAMRKLLTDAGEAARSSQKSLNGDTQ
jgi:hypothetical protein